MECFRSIIGQLIRFGDNNRSRFFEVCQPVTKVDIGICYIHNVSGALGITKYLFLARNVVWARGQRTATLIKCVIDFSTQKERPFCRLTVRDFIK